MSQIPVSVPAQEIMGSGHVACPGCGAAMAMRNALKVLGPKTVVVIPACCWSVIDGPTPHSVVGVPVIHTAFETAAITATGVRAGLRARGEEDVNVMAWAGDGGTFDIGFQSLSGAAERNEDIIYVCYDNEAYMNTGIQRSSATPWGAWTTTTPVNNPKSRPKKNIVDALAAHHIPYIATASVAYPEDLVKKFERAKSIRGMRFIHILSPCPPGWKSVPEQSIRISRLAVKSRVFPLFEVLDGWKYRLTQDPEPVPVNEYLRLQGRFRHLTPEAIDQIQQDVDSRWNQLQQRIASSF
ncbi:MAG: 3-methyl-2-oxobutanoate dehydrogenase subunit beta [Candidatus Neomarinimicrobiota bacterium]|nr:MAG: 3-methyl-2-oxobutanoate dehydrogenase subunit beta [Candidatus Neomarinimicrobiota bacterium]